MKYFVYLCNMKTRISPKVKKIMNNAMGESKGYGYSKLTPEHILIAILLDGNSDITNILIKLRVDIDELFNDTSTFLINNFTGINEYSKKELGVSDEVKTIINEMEIQCKLLNDDEINEHHLMLAMLLSNSTANQLLNKVNINYKIFKETIMREFSENIGGNDPSHKNKANKNNSKTPVLDNFCKNITKAVENGEIDPVIGRKKEIRRISAILSRRKKNNPVLVGEAGVGKSAIVEGLATLIYDEEAPRPLLNKQIYSLDLTSIVAGTKYRGQFEERMKVILDELKNNKHIILFIDELHTMVGAGNASGSLDVSNILKPALANGDIQVIDATTLDEYRENVEKDLALTRRFQKVLVIEPDTKETIEILENIKFNYEDYHNVIYDTKVIEEIVKLSKRYITGRAMPDNAIDIMDEAGAATNIDVKLPQHISEIKTKIKELNEEKINIIKAQRYEDAVPIRDEEVKLNKNLTKLIKQWEQKENENPTIITLDMISDNISNVTGIPITKLSASENTNLKNLTENLQKTVIGQNEAIEKVGKAIKRSRLGIKNEIKPIGSFIFLGVSGSGKSFLAKMLAEQVFGDPEALIRVDMSEYMEKHSMSKLIGSPPGYVGYGEGGKLTEQVRNKPYSLILFDEIEKAHDEIFNLLLQLLDEGHLTDSLGRKIDFKNTLIIMTSNIGVKELSQFGSAMGYETTNSILNEENRAKKIIEKALKKKFKPEFLNRIDDAIIFNTLKPNDIALIIKNEINIVKKRISELGYHLDVNKSAMDYIAEEGYDREYGARPLNRAIQKYVEDPIADEVMDGALKNGGKILIGYNKKDGITTKIS